MNGLELSGLGAMGQSMKIDQISNNIANLEYSLRPLKIESPRTYLVQVTAKF